MSMDTFIKLCTDSPYLDQNPPGNDTVILG